ncbi:YWFCY domain-containing protein [Leadbetterella sp. DM7]|uniref:YWFCY domain-containing protein n=1 Tax=Leadbetterella sp. DM7 TaxID=3235085 RepID=UPI00349EFBB8
MALQTGENEQALRKVLDMTRLISIIILILHFYYYCYSAFSHWGLVNELGDRLLGNIHNSGIFKEFHRSKLISLAFLVISLLGARGRKDEKLNYKVAFAYILTGLLIYFVSYLALLLSVSPPVVASIYMAITMTGFLLLLSGGTLLSRIIKNKLNSKDIFNKENETFPQEERLLQNEYSINLPARYRLKNKVRNSWINIINPFRGLLLLGSPGS